MDFNQLKHLLSNVINVEQYTSVTEKIRKEIKSVKINFSVVSSIVKLKSLEVEYFSKCYDNGVASILFDRLLSRPPCDTWGLLHKEFVSIIEYWIQAIHNQMNNGDCWWKFLRVVMKLIEDIVPKHVQSIPDKLVMLTARTFFDLATRESLSLHQRHEVLHCLNCFSARASRDVRLSQRTKYINYFIPLASCISTCGYMPVQVTALETLVRWLQPRTEPAVRAAAAAWFPPNTCPESVKQHFIQANWRFFTQEARSLLYALNDANQLVMSVVVRKLTIDEKAIYTDADKHRVDELVWLDVNSGVRSISVVLHPKLLRDERTHFVNYETLFVDPDDTRSVLLQNVSGQIAVTVSMSQPPRLLPSALPMVDKSDVTIVVVVSSRTDLTRLDSALGAAFGDKYQLQLDLNETLQLTLSQETTRRRPGESSSEDSIFLHSKVGVKSFRRVRTAGNTVETPRNFTNFNDSGSQSESCPATVTLQPQLQDKQARNKTSRQSQINDEYFKFYASRDLSAVKETTETDDYIAKHYDGVTKTRQIKRNAESDTELLKQKQITTRNSYERGELSANILLAATVGNDESITKSSLNDISNSKDFDTTNITELMIRKVYGAKQNDKLKDSGIVRSTDSDSKDKNEGCSEAIENTPTENVKILTRKSKPKVVKKKPCIVVSKTTTDDESNTDAIETYVDTRTRKTKPTYSITKVSDSAKLSDKQVFRTRQDENHFSPYVGEAEKSGVKAFILAHNQSTVNTSDSFDESGLFMNKDINVDTEQLQILNSEVMECIKDMVDRVCNMLQDQSAWTIKKNEREYSSSSKQTTTTSNKTNTQKKTAATVPKPKKKTRAATKASKAKKANSPSKTKANPKQLPKKMSIIIERDDEESPEDTVIDTAIAKNKTNKEDKIYMASEISTRQRKCKYKSFRKSCESVAQSSSPSTLEKDFIFDKLRSTIENNENIKVVKPKSADEMYNYSSDSDDSDFQITKNDFKRRLNAKKTVDFDSCKSKQKMGRNTSKKPSKDDTQTRKKPAAKKKYTKNKIDIELALNDERMRDKVDEDVLNTSIIAPKLRAVEPVVICTRLEDPIKQKMDYITEDLEPVSNKKESNDTKPNKNKRSLSLLKNKGTKTTSPNNDSGTTSPMPGLIVELAPSRKDDPIDLSFDVIEQKIKRICKEDRDPINDTSNTQHIIFSDTERCNTPQKVPVTIKDNIDVIEKENLVQPDTGKILKECELNKVTNHLPKKKHSETSHANYKNEINDRDVGVMLIDEVVEINDDEPENDDKSEKSMSTNSIHAHVDSDERPPSLGLLDQDIPPRDVNDSDEVENFIWEFHGSASKNRQEKETRLILEKSLKASSRPYQFSSNFREMVPSRRSCKSSSSEHESEIQETSETEKLKPKTSKDDKLRCQEKTSKNITKQRHLKQSKNDIIEILEPKPNVSDACSVNEKLPKVSLASLSQQDIDEWTSKSSRNSNETTHTSRLHSKKTNVSFLKPYHTRGKNQHHEDNLKDKNYRTTSKTSKNSASIENIYRLRSCSKETKNDVIKPYNTRKKIHNYFPTLDERDDSDENANDENFDITKESSVKSKSTKRKTIRDDMSNIDTKQKTAKEKRSAVISPIDITTFELQNKDNQQLTKTKRKSFSPSQHGGKRSKPQNTVNDSKNATVEQKQKNERDERTITRKYKKNVRDEPVTNRHELKLSINEPKSSRIEHKLDKKEPKITQMLEKVPVSETDSVSSIKEWLQQNDRSKRGKYATEAQTNDIVQAVMEMTMRDAQCNEITIKKIIDFLRDLMKEKVLLKQTLEANAKEILQQALDAIVKSNNEIIEDRYQQVKVKVSKIIREQCANKKLSINILKEDIQAALDHS